MLSYEWSPGRVSSRIMLLVRGSWGIMAIQNLDSQRSGGAEQGRGRTVWSNPRCNLNDASSVAPRPRCCLWDARWLRVALELHLRWLAGLCRDEGSLKSPQPAGDARCRRQGPLKSSAS
ncbi:uncharacterized protein B0I36DRAFT_108737 [Microdochium trichocladiopsis]|uniref:Uncharacterized protein n=1 Tax=Microdochium trichocladiopsis TaxID=1682393 RepID=A0A9P8Y9G2_9PEZI|nr:uncharacterized protein B0I36DRAFT_108737 [Microdochium trichocladiopsis]KAH7033423.1 hypothetical protein B0I36DRAFT_108737 [Microdochium trichocladiopsis]